MKRILIAILSIIMILVSSFTVFAGDIPESLLHSEDAEIFFGEVIAYHPDKENPTITVSPVAMIKGDKAKDRKDLHGARSGKTIGSGMLFS